MANTSDYNKTQRRLLPDGTVQYVAGGSRLRTQPGMEGAASRVGKIKPEEIYGSMPVVMSDENKLQAYKGYGSNPDEGIELAPNEKIAVRQWNKEGTKYWHMGKWRSKDAPVHIGDTIVITAKGDVNEGERAIVKNIRSENTWTISAIILTGKFRGVKYVYEADQYAIKKKVGVITKDDYLLQGLARTQTIVKEDKAD